MPGVKKKHKPDRVGRIEQDEQNGVDLPLVVYEKWCKGCGICAEFCPKGVLEIDPNTQKARVAHPEECIHCGRCELRCPDFAITRLKKKERNNGDREKGG